MIKKEKIVFVDLLYKPGGSFDEDFEALRLALSEDYNILYLKFSANHFYKAIPLIFYHIIFARCKKVIFLSSKLSSLFLFIPLRIFAKFYAIYHFIPNSRKGLHENALRWICKVYKIGVYSKGVLKAIQGFHGVKATVLPSRIVDKHFSIYLLREKLSQNAINILIPALRAGVRQSVKIEPILAELEVKLGYSVKNIYSHGSGSVISSGHNLITLSQNLERSSYYKLFHEALFVLIKFDCCYEERASGVVLDALANGCIVVTECHPIVNQYGFPFSVVTDLENLENIVKTIKTATDEELTSMIPGVNFHEYKEKWTAFIS